MDASAYLKRQGWRGSGFSLDQTDRGISRPLALTKKVDVLGVGIKKHAAVSDQWWMRAFDDGLKNLGTGNQTVLASVQKHGISAGGLYGRFVKGQTISGTFDELNDSTPSANESTTSPTPEDSESESESEESISSKSSLVSSDSDSSDSDDTSSMSSKQSNSEAGESRPVAGVKRKRERGETAPEKRARRKRERQVKARENANYDVGPAELREKEIREKADTFVNEAIRRGLLPAETSGTHHKNRGMAAYFYGEEVCEKVFAAAGLDSTTGQIKGSERQQKITREGLKRSLRRAAKAYLNKAIPVTQIELADAEEKAKRKAAKSEKEAALKSRTSEKELKEKAKKERRQLKLATKRAIVEEDRAAAAAAGVALNGDAVEPGPDDFRAGDDEVMLDAPTSLTGKKAKKVPGVGRVDKYPSKAEKRATKMRALAMQRAAEARVAALAGSETDKIDLYRAKQHGLEVQEYREKLAKGEISLAPVKTSTLSAEKIATYTKRAAEKGVSLEEYIKRRDDKFAAKQGQKLVQPAAESPIELAAPSVHPSRASRVPETTPADTLATAGFISDTTGDATLTTLTTTHQALSSNKSPHVIGPDGSIRYTVTPGVPVPLDPTIWADIVVKTLPRPVREARRQWMAVRRAERKAGEATAPSNTATKKKLKGQRKIETRERFVGKILQASRAAAATPGAEFAPVVIDGIENVPLVKTQSTKGGFSKVEMGLARTVARRVMRMQKRAEREAKGKGKGYKKRERAAKEAARNAGIYGAEKFGWGAQGLPGVQREQAAMAGV